jgi:hypothetical protein
VLMRGVIVHQVTQIHTATADRLLQSEARAGPLPHLCPCSFCYSSRTCTRASAYTFSACFLYADRAVSSFIFATQFLF